MAFPPPPLCFLDEPTRHHTNWLCVCAAHEKKRPQPQDVCSPATTAKTALPTPRSAPEAAAEKAAAAAAAATCGDEFDGGLAKLIGSGHDCFGSDIDNFDFANVVAAFRDDSNNGSCSDGELDELKENEEE